MSQDVSGDVADLIGDAKTFGSSENIRHGTYKFLIKRIYAQLVENDKGQHKMAFWELTPLESKPNPQFEGDRVDYVSPTQPGTGPLRDDGTKPNPVGSSCALKVDFDGAGGRSAGSNIKDAILALFNKRPGEITNEEVKSTWRDLSRERDLQVGDAIGIGPDNKPILATKAKLAQPACGMVINCTTMTKKKKTPNEKGAYITKLIWSCAAPIGTGENSPELVAKRRAEILAEMPDEEEEDTSTATPPRTGPINAPQNGHMMAPTAPSAPQPPAPPSPPSPPAPTPPAAFTPVLPWKPLPNHPVGPTPDQRWYWSDPAAGGTNAVKNEAQLISGQ